MDSNNAGLFISQIGASVPTAADHQFVFNSNWPSLQIAYQATVNVPYTNSNNSTVIPHNLGFYPFTLAWLSINGLLIYSFFTVAGNFTGGGSFSNTTFEVDKTNVYPKWQFADEELSGLDPFGNQGNLIDGSLIAQVTIICYNLDLTQVATYPTPTPAVVKTPYDPTAGIKVVKEGKNIASTDLRDFILHSRAQSPALLSVLTQAQGITDPNITGNILIQYTNPAGYTSWFFGFQLVNINGNLRYAAIPIQASGYSTSGANVLGQNTFQLSVPSTPGGTMVVLRDPLFAPNNVQATY